MKESREANALVSFKRDAQFATVSINRPQRHNSLVPELLQQLVACFDEIKADDGIKLVILRAIGDSFSTGGDLREFLEHRDDLADYADALVGDLNDAIVAIIECEVPVLVAVDGQVTGGSLGLVIACDLVVVTEKASFTPYYVDVGLGPDGGWTAILPHIIGRGRARSVQLMNETISAGQAVDWGIACRLVANDQLDWVLEEICNRIIEKKRGSLKMTKQLLRQTDYRERLEDERRVFVEKILSQEAREGVAAFVGRRKR